MHVAKYPPTMLHVGSQSGGIDVAARGDSESHLLEIIPRLLPCTYPHLARRTKRGLKLSTSAGVLGEGRKQCQSRTTQQILH